jgi:hypothetical protein
MASKAARSVRYGQLMFAGGLLLCLALMPHFLFERNEGGVSNYGVHALTVVPYTVAFGAFSLSLLSAARSLPPTTRSASAIRRCLTLLAGLLFLALVSTYPYKLNHVLDNVHIAAAIALVMAEVIVGGWFVLRLARDRLNLVFYGVQLIGFGLSFLTFIGSLHVLFASQLVMSLGFGVVLVRTIAHLTKGSQSDNSAAIRLFRARSAV